MEAFVFLGTVIGIIAGIAQIVDGINNDQNRKLMQIALGALFLVIASGYMFYFFYSGPRQVGDTFLEGLRELRYSQMQSVSCVDSELYRTLGGGLGFLGDLMSPFATGSITNYSYNPFTRTIGFVWTPSSNLLGPQEGQRGIIRIRSESLTDFCIYELV